MVELYEQYRLECNKAYRLQKEAEECQRDLDAGRPLRMPLEMVAVQFGIPEKRLREAFRQAGLL